MKPILLPLPIAARRLRVPRDWLASEAAAGRLPALPAGNTFIFELEALTEALAARARGGRPRPRRHAAPEAST